MPHGTSPAGVAALASGPTPARPASARALQRALYASRSVVHADAADSDRLSWVRGLVQQTESGQVYAAAAEATAERERQGVESGSAVNTVDAASAAGRCVACNTNTPSFRSQRYRATKHRLAMQYGVRRAWCCLHGLLPSQSCCCPRRAERASLALGGRPFRRGPLPALRTVRREDAMVLQAWLADTLQQVVRKAPATAAAAAAAAAAATKAQNSTGAGVEAGATSEAGQEPHPAEAAGTKGTPGSSSSSSSAVDVESGAAGEAGSTGRHAADVADAAQYVLGVAMEELRRQVSAECKVRRSCMLTGLESVHGNLSIGQQLPPIA